MDRRRPDRPPVDAPAPPGAKPHVITTFDGKSYRRRASHQTVWELASDHERKRLTALSRPDLLAAVKANAIVDLTEADQGLVLEYLYPMEALAATASAATGSRKPKPFAGKGLPCGPRVGPNLRRRLMIALAIAGPTTWALILLLGYALAQGGQG